MKFSPSGASVLVDRVGRWSACIVVALGVLYIVALCAGVRVFGLTTPIADPILAVMEILTVLSAFALTVMVASIAASQPSRVAVLERLRWRSSARLRESPRSYTSLR